jgi:predicted porin
LNRTGCVGRAGHGIIVQNDQLPVSGAADIHFKYVNSQFNGLAEGVNGVFRTQADASTMGDDEEFIRNEEGMVRYGPGKQTQDIIDDEKEQQQDKQCFDALLQNFHVIFNRGWKPLPQSNI